MNRTLLAASIILILSSACAMLTHRSSLTPVAVPVLDLVHPDPAISAQASYPILEKETYDQSDADQSWEASHEMLNFHQESTRFLFYWLSTFTGVLALLLFLWESVRTKVRFFKPAIITGFVILLYGLKHLFLGSTGAIITFDTMSISGGSSPFVFTQNIGLCMEGIQSGWIVSLVGASVILLGSIPALNLSSYSFNRAPRTLLIISMVILGLVAATQLLAFSAKLQLGQIPSQPDPSTVAALISKFLMSLAGSQLMLFFGILLAIIAVAICKPESNPSTSEGS